jgi:replicative DNA helicase
MAIVYSERENRDLGLEHSLLYHLIKNERRHTILTWCYPALFSNDETKAIFKVIKELGDQASLLSVAMKMEEKHQKNRQETFSLFSHGIVPALAEGETPEDVIHQLKLLLFKRLAFDRLFRMANLIENGKPSAEEDSGNLYDETSKLLLAENRLVRNRRSSVDEIAKAIAERINTTSDVIRTGFTFINKRTGGLTRRHISSLLAAPGHGKSLFSDALMYETLRTNNEVGLVISLEDPVEERFKRIVANRLDISLADMRFKKVIIPEADILHILKVELGGRLHMVDTRQVIRPDEAAIAISDIKPQLVVVDYIQSFQLPDMIQGLIEAARILEVAAMRNDCHILVCSQVPDKDIAKRDNPQPGASDVQWTSAIRQKSAEMFSLYYQYQDTTNFIQQNILSFKILKARYAAAIGTIQLEINPDKGRIVKEISFEE